MQQKIKKLSKDKLAKILCTIADILSPEQTAELEKLIDEVAKDNAAAEKKPRVTRMSQEFVNEKMAQIKVWMRQIDDGELYLDAEEYEDYSDGYWSDEWITEYYDNQGIADKLLSMIEFVKDCIDDRKYIEAQDILEWLWDMEVDVDDEFTDVIVLEEMVDKEILRTDIKKLALLTLYAEYQVRSPETRAKELYLYFTLPPFQTLHIEEMFHAGREQLVGLERFWEDWITLLKSKEGDVESRLLEEAVLHCEGIQGLVKRAEENASTHPSLYMAAIREYDKYHEYDGIEALGKNAMHTLNSDMVIRSRIALAAASAADFLGHTDEMMTFCWEAFRSNSTERNLLRLFGTAEMAEKYGLRGKEIVSQCRKGTGSYANNLELQRNEVDDYTYLMLCFYTGNFERVKVESKNPTGSLGWSGRFTPYGIRLILLYLYDNTSPSKAATAVAGYVNINNLENSVCKMSFERKIEEESSNGKTSVFWNYFQKWKQYFPMAQQEKEAYISWAEKIIYSRADAIVSGQHRNHYAQSAQLLAIVGEIKESMGDIGAKNQIYAEYKRKYPRHYSFQGEMKTYFL